MNIKEEDVFLILLEARLRRSETGGFNATYAQMTLAVVDSTKEVMSILGKMSKSSLNQAVQKGEHDPKS